MRLISLAALLSTTSATVLLSYVPDDWKIGQSYEVEYLMNRPYSLQLYLVQKGTQPNICWTGVKILFQNVDANPCNGSYTVLVDETWPTSKNGELYGLWIRGEAYSGDLGFADLTNWSSINES